MIHIGLRQKSFLLIIIFVFLNLNIAVKAQTRSDGSSPQFLFPDFTPGRVKMKNGLSQTAKLNYNTVSEKMVYEKEGKLYDLVNIHEIDAIYLKNYVFVPGGGVFHQVLFIAPIPLLVKYKGEVLPESSVVGYGGKSEVSNAKYLSSVALSMGYHNLQMPADFSVKIDKIYLIRIKGHLHKFMNERQFLKIFHDNQIGLKEFIKQKNINFENLTDMIELLRYCNELYSPVLQLS